MNLEYELAAHCFATALFVQSSGVEWYGHARWNGRDSTLILTALTISVGQGIDIIRDYTYNIDYRVPGWG